MPGVSEVAPSFPSLDFEIFRVSYTHVRSMIRRREMQLDSFFYGSGSRVRPWGGPAADYSKLSCQSVLCRFGMQIIVHKIMLPGGGGGVDLEVSRTHGA